MNDLMIRMKYIISPLSVLFFILFLSGNLKAADNPATVSLFERGVTEFNAENYEEALVLFEEAYKEIRTDPQIISYLGLTHRELQNFPEAVRFFKEAIRLEPKAGDANFLLADVLYNTGDFEEALSVVETALSKGIRPPESTYLKGQILLMLKRGKEAVEAFNEAKSLDPALTQQADFQIALAYFNEKEFKKAEELFRGLITIDPTSDWALFSKDYLEAIEKRRPPYRLNLSAGIQYDDNVLAVPIDQSLIGIKKRGDWNWVFSLFGEYTFHEGEAWNTKASYSLNTTRHSQSSYPTDNGGTVFSPDIENHTVALMPSYNTKKSVSSIMLSFSYLKIASAPYMMTLGVNPAYTFLINDNHFGQLSLKYRKQDQDLDFFRKESLPFPAAEEERSANNYSGGVGYIYTFSKGNGLINMRLDGELNEAEHGRNWTYRGTRASGGLLYPFANNKTKLNLYLEFYNQDFTNVNTIYGVKRNDNTITIQPSLIYAVTKFLELNVEYAYTNDASNVSVYNYIKNLYTANIVFRF